MNPLQIQKDFYKEMDESIKEELQSLRGEQGLQLLWNACKPKCSKTVQANNIEEVYINNYSDEYKSGGVIGLVKMFIQVQYKNSMYDWDNIPVQKDLLFANKIDGKFKDNKSVVVMSSYFSEDTTESLIGLLRRLGKGEIKFTTLAKKVFKDKMQSILRIVKKENQTTFVTTSHPVHWLDTSQYQTYLPRLWEKKVCLIFLPKSTSVVKRQIKAAELTTIATRIREQGLTPVACFYPDKTSIAWYYKLEEIHNIFDDIIWAGHVYNKMQLIKLLTFIDASHEVCSLETDDDPSGCLSISTVLSVYRGKYVNMLNPKMKVFTRSGRGARKTLSRYPDGLTLKKIRYIVRRLSKCSSYQQQEKILMDHKILDIKYS